MPNIIQRILNPILCPEELQTRYSIIEALQSTIEDSNITIWKQLEDNLRQTTYDIERLQRKIMIKTIQPYELYNLDLAYHTIKNIFQFLSKINNKVITDKLLPNKDLLTQFNEFINEFKSTFDMEAILKFHLNDIQSSLFKDGIFPEIDQIQNEMIGSARHSGDRNALRLETWRCSKIIFF